ncbi:hypothetical protein, partial [Kitasatospora sp. NPDC047058]|uniref:hypothetical protein n=1 Tax=Kitasatospora sp. NPDC047058 TaxID=3155620 RepID=UPI0033C4FFD8
RRWHGAQDGLAHHDTSGGGEEDREQGPGEEGCGAAQEYDGREEDGLVVRAEGDGRHIGPQERRHPDIVA